jgi:hypothetical protein
MQRFGAQQTQSGAQLMFKPRLAIASLSSLPKDQAVRRLSLSELAMVLGGQGRPNPAQELSDQFDDTVTSVLEAVEPLFAPVREGVELAYAAGNYARWAVEHQESREISEERGLQLEAEQREAEEQKHRQQEEERDRLLQSDKETTSDDVQQWLDSTQEPYGGEFPSIPSNMINSGSHTPEIVIEEVYYDGGSY